MERRRESQAAKAKANAPAWERLMRGLWLSGLRIGEAVSLQPGSAFAREDRSEPRVDRRSFVCRYCSPSAFSASTCSWGMMPRRMK